MTHGFRLDRISLACLLLVAGLCLGQRVSAQFLYWNYHNILDEQRESGARPDMAMDDSGNFHVVYWQQDEDRLIYAFRAEGSAVWTREYVDAGRPNGYISAIAVDGSGIPHVVYMENDNFVARYRYARRAGPNNWLVEAIPDDPVRGWGEYGPNGPVNVSDRVQHSADILIQPGGDPQVVFFDGWASPSAFPDCTPSSNYGFRMHQATKLFGQWYVGDLGLVPDVENSCGEGANPYPLPRGDRYGEFGKVVQLGNGDLEAYAVSKFNNNVLRFRTTSSDTTWVYGQVDSLGGNLFPPWWSWSQRFFTFNGLDATVDRNNEVHLAYGISFNYGENFCCVGDVNKLVYARIVDGDTAYRYSLGDSANFTYRNYTSLATQGTDSVYLVYADLTTFQLKMYESVDSGKTWAHDTIADFLALSRSPVAISNDSLRVLYYDSGTESLTLAHRWLGGGAWRYEPLTTSQLHGESLDGTVVAVAGDTVGYVAFNDGFLGKLFFAAGTANGAWNFQVEELDQAGGQVKAVSFALGPVQEPCVAFASGASGDLRLAVYSNNAWNYETVDTAANVAFTDVAVSAQDTLHLVYYDDNLNCLRHASRHFAQTQWRYDSIPCDSLPVGEYPSLVVDAAGVPHVSYYDDGGLQLLYARRNPVGFAWEVDTVYQAVPSAVGKFNSLRLDANGRPVIAFLDEQRTDVLLAEQDAQGAWTLSTVDSSSVTSIGRPTRLSLDQFGKPWVAYNYYTNFDRVRLMHRDPDWREVAVSSQGQIARAFVFEIIGGDLFILGKKNEEGNTGVAMLHAPGGVFVEREAPQPEPTGFVLSNYPNPFTGRTTFRLELEAPQTLSLEILDLHGKRVGQLLDHRKCSAGIHTFEYRADGLAPGVYLCVVSNGQSRQVKKLVVGN